MQGKGLFKFFIVALVLVCLYQLMFTFATYRVEKHAEAYANEKVLGEATDPAALFTGEESQKGAFIDSVHGVVSSTKRRFLDSVSSEVVLDIFIDDYTFDEIKARQINLGLDLQGGMSVVLQISVDGIVNAMSNYSKDPTFVKALALAKEKQKNAQEDFVTLFGAAFKEIDPGAKLAAIFATPEFKDRITFNSTNDEVLAVIRQEANDAVGRTFSIMRARIDEFGVAQPNVSLQENTGRIIVELPGVDDPERARKILQSTAKLEFWETYENQELFNFFLTANDVLSEKLGLNDTSAGVDSLLTGADSLLTSTEPAAVETTAAAIDSTDPLGLLGNDSASAEELLGEEDSMNKQIFPLFSNTSILIPATAQDANGQVVLREGPAVGYSYGQDRKKVMEYLEYEEVKALFPKNIKFLWSAKPFSNNLYELFAIKTRPNEDKAPLEGGAIIDARQDFDNNGKPDIDMVMNSEGSKTWRRLTKDNIGKCVAIVLDDEVYSAPVVQAEIAGGKSQITGNFEIADAKDLASIIKSGKLPAPAQIIEEEIVGPTLGAESIRAGLISLVLGLIGVLIFMVIYYTTSGIIADIAVLLNLFFMIGILASFGASLTLSGMAGIVLSLGMAVDANVIINERIREELARGKSLRLSVQDGFSASYSAIIDGNLTTMITGFILLFFGLGPVKGFATTLVIGLFTSFITAVIVSRLIFDWALAKEKNIKFSTKLTEGAFKNANYQFIANRKYAYMFVGATLVIGLASFFTKGFDLGVDFKGGRTYIVRFDKNIQSEEVASSLENVFGAYPQVKTYGGPNQASITTAFMIDEEESLLADSIVEAALYDGVKSLYEKEPTREDFHNIYKLSSIKVGAAIADDIKAGALKAAIFAIIGIFIYVFFRFKTWQYGLGAIAAVVYNAIFLLTIFSVFGGLLPFSTEIDQTFIAALLTVLGYSVNDTVVVFDRIRENLNLHPTKDFKTIVNMSINNTLSRTIVTGCTTLLVIIVMMIFGGEVIRGFCFALLIGIIIGTFSSIFVATPVMVDLQRNKMPKA